MRHNRAWGFSLIELMVTIAIVAILLAVAFPSFEGSLRSNRVATTANELMGSLSLARSEALRNPGGAVVCTSSNGTACDTSSDWNDGWIVWIDTSGDGLLDAGERIVRYVQTSDKLDLTATAAVVSPTVIGFDARGRVSDNVARNFVLQPTACTAGQPFRRTLALTPTGRAQLSKANCI